jgi:hypothetical protein
MTGAPIGGGTGVACSTVTTASGGMAEPAAGRLHDVVSKSKTISSRFNFIQMLLPEKNNAKSQGRKGLERHP